MHQTSLATIVPPSLLPSSSVCRAPPRSWASRFPALPRNRASYGIGVRGRTTYPRGEVNAETPAAERKRPRSTSDVCSDTITGDYSTKDSCPLRACLESPSRALSESSGNSEPAGGSPLIHIQPSESEELKVDFSGDDVWIDHTNDEEMVGEIEAVQMSVEERLKSDSCDLSDPSSTVSIRPTVRVVQIAEETYHRVITQHRTSCPLCQKSSEENIRGVWSCDTRPRADGTSQLIDRAAILRHQVNAFLNQHNEHTVSLCCGGNGDKLCAARGGIAFLNAVMAGIL